MTTRRRFLAGAAALVVAPWPSTKLTFASGARYDPANCVITLDGVRLRGPADGAFYMWSDESRVQVTLPLRPAKSQPWAATLELARAAALASAPAWPWPLWTSDVMARLLRLR